jgi:hypothetical protein
MSYDVIVVVMLQSHSSVFLSMFDVGMYYVLG